jgi:hypothetical protein
VLRNARAISAEIGGGDAVYNKTDTLKPNQKLVPALPAPPVITPPGLIE